MNLKDYLIYNPLLVTCGPDFICGTNVHNATAEDIGSLLIY
jgi:hypothetical protein